MKYLSIVLLVLSVQLNARDVSYIADAFGYQTLGNCDSQYLSIQNEASTVTLVAVGGSDANDEGGGTISLTEPFWFYNKSHEQLVVSSNGYLAFADGLNAENGGDFSNDCPFPSIPDNQPQSLQRIMPFHDDLENSGNGAIRTAYYASCPNIAASGSCTVIEWSNWRIRGQNDVFSFQVELHHQSSVIKIQYTGNNPSTNSASIGFQQTELFSGQVLSCNQSIPNLSDQSFCYQNPVIFIDGFE